MQKLLFIETAEKSDIFLVNASRMVQFKYEEIGPKKQSIGSASTDAQRPSFRPLTTNIKLHESQWQEVA